MAIYMHVVGVVAVASLIYLIMPMLVVLFVGFVVLRPFGESIYLKFACRLQEQFLVPFVFFMETVARIELRVTGVWPPCEGSLVLANHLTHDWAPMYLMAMRQGTLAYVRTVIKKSMSYVPFFGWGMTLCYWPFVSRDFNKDEKVLNKLFTAYRSNNLPVQLWLYPEGTRQTKRKLAESQQYQKEKGYTVWEHVMLPRHRGFATAVNALKGVVSNVHEVTLQYEGWGGKPPGFWQIVTADPAKKHVMHVHVNRVSMDSIPADDEAKKEWLMECFQRKENLLAHYAKSGAFPGNNQTQPKKTVAVVAQTVLLFVATTVLYRVLGFF